MSNYGTGPRGGRGGDHRNPHVSAPKAFTARFKSSTSASVMGGRFQGRRGLRGSRSSTMTREHAPQRLGAGMSHGNSSRCPRGVNPFTVFCTVLSTRAMLRSMPYCCFIPAYMCWPNVRSSHRSARLSLSSFARRRTLLSFSTATSMYQSIRASWSGSFSRVESRALFSCCSCIFLLVVSTLKSSKVRARLY